MQNAFLRFLVLLVGVALARVSAAAPIGLNSATPEQLAQIEGVSKELAEKIVSLRTERGTLSSVDALRVLPGISEEALSALRRTVAVDIQLSPPEPAKFVRPEQVLAEFAHEPTVQQTQAWAVQAAKVSPERIQRWLRQSKTFAALPVLWARYRLTNDWNQAFQYYAQDGVVDQEGEVVFDVIDDARTSQEAQYMVQARWDLDELVMSSRRVSIIRESRNTIKLRDQILTEVNRLYFERRRIQAEILLAPKTDVLGQVKDELRVMELTAHLDALTSGRFSAALARQGPHVLPRKKE